MSEQIASSTGASTLTRPLFRQYLKMVQICAGKEGNFKGHHSSFSIATEAVKALIFLPFSSVFCHFESSLAHYVSFEMTNTSKTGADTALGLASIASEVIGRGKRLCTECEGWPPASTHIVGENKYLGTINLLSTEYTEY